MQFGFEFAKAASWSRGKRCRCMFSSSLGQGPGSCRCPHSWSVKMLTKSALRFKCTVQCQILRKLSAPCRRLHFDPRPTGGRARGGI
jgi:hypothetical protein